MGLRETLNKKPGLAAGLGIALLVLGIAFIALQLSLGGPREPSGMAYFSTDDGQTWFVDSADKLPPFQHDGKEAFRAYVFECGGKEFVNHLERYTPEAKKTMEAALEAERSGKAPPSAGAIQQAASAGRQLKKPGAKEWVAAGNFAKTGPILNVKCPDGGGEVTPVEP